MRPLSACPFSVTSYVANTHGESHNAPQDLYEADIDIDLFAMTAAAAPFDPRRFFAVCFLQKRGIDERLCTPATQKRTMAAARLPLMNEQMETHRPLCPTLANSTAVRGSA